MLAAYHWQGKVVSCSCNVLSPLHYLSPFPPCLVTRVARKLPQQHPNGQPFHTSCIKNHHPPVLGASSQSEYLCTPWTKGVLLSISCRNSGTTEPCCISCWWMGQMALSLFRSNIGLGIASTTVYRLALVTSTYGKTDTPALRIPHPSSRSSCSFSGLRCWPDA